MTLDQTPLISRRRLFGNPERGTCRISPDGRWLAFGAPRDGVMNLWVCPRGDLAAARPLTDDRRRGVSQFSWAYDNAHLLYAQDEGGDENFHLHAVSIASGVSRDLTPHAGARGLLHAVSRTRPDEVLITLNQRDLRFADLYRVNIASGQMSLVQQNPGMAGFVTDDEFSVRMALAPQPDGGWMWLLPEGAGGWTDWQRVPAADAMTTRPAYVGADGRTLYALDSRGRDTAALVSFDLAAAAPTVRVIAEHPRADVNELLTHVHSHVPLAYASEVERREMHVLDDSVRADVATLDAQNLGDWRLVSRSDDDRVWVVLFTGDLNPASVVLFERDTQRVSKLYDCLPSLADRAVAPLARMQPTTLTSRDGLPLVSYLTLPVHADRSDQALASTEPLPLVLIVHGGPWARDSFGYDPQHQWLANRGYAVLSVNFRASTGFGKSFINAGDLEWGGKMDDDLCDAVDWAVARHRRPEARCHHGRQLRGVRRAVGADRAPRALRLRRGHRRAIEPGDPAGFDTAAVGGHAYRVVPAVGPPGHRRRPGTAQGTLTAASRVGHPQAAADRAGRQRPARQAGRGRPDGGGHGSQCHPGDLRALPRRGPRLHATGQPPVVLRHRRALSGAPPWRAQ
jgi:dipeptidyl aminopeptidase/acylaminoacyl peptidase